MWFLLQDNARQYAALSVKEFLLVHQIAVLPHAPFLQVCHLATSFLFPQIKRALTVHRYADMQAIQTVVTNQLFSIPDSVLLDCFKGLQQNWKPCIRAG